MVDRFERFSYAISVISRLWHRIASDEMGKYGLKGSNSVYFTTLQRFPEGVTAAQLVELCCRDKADVSRAMKLLEEKGFVRRIDPIGKAYRTPLQLTEQGALLAEQISRKARLAVEQASLGLSDEKRVIFYEALDVITTNLHRVSREGLESGE